MDKVQWICSIGLFVTGWSSVLFADRDTLQFNRDIRPILSETCFHCHGPDAEGRKAKLRFDLPEATVENDKGWRPIVPGNPEASEAWARIITDDPDELMPPADSHLALDDEQKALIKRWISEGAEYEKHWAFVPPVKNTELKSQNPNPVDGFIADRLKAEGLSFSSPASKATLLRRVYLDLTGLPPSIEAVEAFVADTSNDAFAKVVDQLLASPQCAERLALEWLDVARYADTNGYSIDDHRDMWAWRDWVIHAFLTNKPYNEFLVEQLAGDLIENATDQQKIATGFLRNSMNTHEGGTIAEEYRVAYVADKIDTVSTAMMGLTIKCAQCHDHKYDPISQKDYYRFFAFFNTSSEPGKGRTNSNTAPMIPVTSALQPKDEQFNLAIDQRIASLQENIDAPAGELAAARRAWEQEQIEKTHAVVLKGTEAEPPAFPVPSPELKGAQPHWIWSDAAGANEWAYFRKAFILDALPESAQLFISCDNEAEVWVNGKLAGKNPDWREPALLNVRPYLVKGRNMIAIAGKDWDGGSLAGLSCLLALSTKDQPETYFPSDQSWEVSAEKVAGWNQSGAVAGFAKAFELKPYGAAPYGAVMDKIKARPVSNVNMARALRTPRQSRSKEQNALLSDAFNKTNPGMQKIAHSIKTEIKILQDMKKKGQSTVMVMDEGASDRKTYMLNRGQYDLRGEEVTAGIPEVFGELPADLPANRLALATWLTESNNPLTARVAVNRYWQMLFGLGLVKTTEDFGSQGEWPSHPKLLDWLAVDFVEHGWDVRHLLRQMMLSKSYQQRSDSSDHLQEVDPYNRLFARAPRYRLQAELVRDTVLSTSGLLSAKVGGPSVYPYQPHGLWKEVSHFGHPTVFTAQHFYRDGLPGLYRRSMYTFWKRTSPPPSMTAFDAPSRETCTVRRLRTNTPLQALVLMNDPQYVEAARFFAQDLLKQPGSVEDSVSRAFYRATSRQPSHEELAILKQNYARQRAYFSEDEERAESFLEIGEAPKEGAQDLVELAAMTSVCSLVLNLDESITRE